MVKEAAKRKIILAGGYYIKAFRLAPGPLGRLRDPAKKEFAISRRLFEKGITPRPAGYGVSGRWSYFAARKAPGVELETFLKESFLLLSRKEIKEFEDLFAAFVMEIASCGVFQPDFHLNNCLFHQKSKRFFLLDLHRANLERGPLETGQVMKQLFYVLPPFLEKVGQRNILETASCLVSMGLSDLKDRKKRYHILEKSLSDMRRHYQGKEERKIKALQVISRKKGLCLFRDAGTDKSLLHDLSCLLLEPETFLKDPSVTRQIIKDSRHTLCLRANLRGEELFIKAYRSSSALKSLSYLARRPRAVRTWNLSYKICFRAVPVIMPMAAVQAFNPWKPVYGAVIFPWLDQVKETRTRIEHALSHQVSADLFLKHLSCFIWMMHEKGIFHGDCKITNFVYCPPGGQGHPEFMVFDLDAARIEKQVSDKRRILDISCMCRSLEKLCTKTDLDITSMFLGYYVKFYLPWENKYDSIARKVTLTNQKKKGKAG